MAAKKNDESLLNETNILEKFPELAGTLETAKGGDWKVVASRQRMWAHAARVPAIGVITGTLTGLERPGESDPTKKFFDACIMRLMSPTLVQDEEGSSQMEVRGVRRGVSVAQKGEDVLIVITAGLEKLKTFGLLPDRADVDVLPIVKVSVLGVKTLDKNRQMYETDISVGEVISKTELFGEMAEFIKKLQGDKNGTPKALHA